MVLCIVPNPSVDTLIEVGSFTHGKVNRIKKERAYPGGKGTHVALALHELEVDTKLLGIWAGYTGKWIRSECANYGLECIGPEIDGRNRSCYTIMESESREETELLGAGPSLMDEDFSSFLAIFEKYVPDCELVCMSGSWPEQAPPDAYDEMILLARKAQKKVMLDCSGALLENALDEHPWGVHLNIEEGKAMFDTSNPIEIVNHVYGHCDIAAVTAGAGGLYLRMGNDLLHAVCPVDPVKSTVGSGDCLVAGLSRAYLLGRKPDEIAAWAVACGAANCLREELGMLYKKDVERLKSRSVVKEINKSEM